MRGSRRGSAPSTAAWNRGATRQVASGAAAILLLLGSQARADHEADLNPWYDGEVQVHLRLERGEGAVYAQGETVRLGFSSDVDAYHLVYAIDSDGFVRLLFPRWWEDDGWVPAGMEIELGPRDLAWPASRWGTSGIVYVEALASPEPFDFAALDLSLRGDCGSWRLDGHPFRIEGDPFLAFNDVHRLLFPHWDEATFTADYSYFYVQEVRTAPRYLGYAYERVYLPPPAPRFSAGLRFGWSWEFGTGYCRPVYSRYYVPGVHVVYHPLHHYHHVVYAERPFAGPAAVVPAAMPRATWLPDRTRERVALEPSRQRERRERVESPRGARRVHASVRRDLRRGQEKAERRPLPPDPKATQKRTKVQAKQRN